MTEKLRNILSRLLVAAVFVLFFALVIIGRTPISWGRLGLALTGLCGLIVLLYLYNRKHR